MSREIKFRAWDGEKMWLMPKMLVGVGQIGFTDEHYVDLNDYDHEPVDLMQYTGLKDKNGVEIYEGDIIKRRQAFSKPETLTIAYPDYLYRFYDSEQPVIEAECEVIGNIYENPELLEAGDAQDA